MDPNNNPEPVLVYDRDQLFHLKTSLISALFEPLTLPQRMMMKNVYISITEHFPGDVNYAYWSNLYSRFRHLRWNSTTRSEMLTYICETPEYRRELEQYQNDPHNNTRRHPLRLAEDFVHQEFFHICNFSPLESLILQQMPYLPRNGLPAASGGIVWLTDSIYGGNTLRQLKINVNDIDRRWFFTIDPNASDDEQKFQLQQSDSMLYMLHCYYKVFWKIREKLEKFLLFFSLETPLEYGLSDDCTTRLMHYFSRYQLRSVYFLPWFDEFSQDITGRMWRDFFQPFRVLEEYYVAIHDTDEWESWSQIQLWHRWSYYFAPPPQLRTLHLYWWGKLTPVNVEAVLQDLFIQKLSKYTSVKRFEVMLSFKTTQQWVDEVHTLFRATIIQMKYQLVQRKKDGNELRWPYRSLVLKFLDNAAHNEMLGINDDDEFMFDNENDRKVHLPESTLLCKVLAGKFATNLRKLFIYMYDEVDPLPISAPCIRSVSCDLSPLSAGIESFYPVFASFKHPTQVRVLQLKNFSKNETTTPVPDEGTRRRRAMLYTRMFAYFFTLFHQMECIELSSDERKPDILDEKTFDSIRRNQFYTRYSDVLLERIRDQCKSSPIRELSLLDAQPKPIPFVVELIRLFIGLAQQNVNEHFLLHIQQCDLRVVRNRNQQQEMTEEEMIVRSVASYREVLAQASYAPNLCLLSPR